MLKKFFTAVGILLFCVWIVPASDILPGHDDGQLQKKKDVPLTRIVLPDLVLEKIETKSEPYGEDKIKLDIKYWVYNNSTVDSSCCPTEEGKKAWEDNAITNQTYELRIEVRSYPNGRFKELRKIGTQTRAGERQEYLASDTFKKGIRRQYRITADAFNWIKEKDENNNQKKKIWPLRPVRKKISPRK